MGNHQKWYLLIVLCLDFLLQNKYDHIGKTKKRATGKFNFNTVSRVDF